MHIASWGPYWVKRNSTTLPCEPVVYAQYPFVQNYPDADIDFDINGWCYIYDLPVLGGTSFNLNLSGFTPSWIADDGTVVVALVLPNNLEVDGPAISAGVIDQWGFIRSFPITQPASVAAYSSVPNDFTGTTFVPTGWTEYPGVASFDAWGGRSYVQFRNYGLPIIYEMWYSLNTARVDKTKGYDNYSWAGDGGALSFPYVEVSANSGHVRKYYAGMFKVTTNMYAPADSDFIAGVSYVGDETGGVLRAIVNGVVVETKNLLVAAQYIYGAYEGGIFEGTPAQFGTGKNTVRFLNVDAGTGVTYESIWWEPPYGDASTFIDTYQVKMAWMVDSYTGLADGTYDAAAIGHWYPPSFYSLPNPPLPCDPNEPLPGTVFTPAAPLNTLMFLETFSGVGKIQGKLPDISPEGITWVEHWNYEPDQPTVMNAGGLYKLEYPYADWQELWIEDTVGSPNYGTAKLTNVRSFEIGWYDYPITGTSYHRLELDCRNDFGAASIYISVTGGPEIDYLEIYLSVTDNNGNTGSGTYNLPSHAFNWDTLNTVRVEIDYFQQRVYFNGALTFSVAAPLDSGIDLNMFFVEQFWISLDYLWFSQLTTDTTFVNTTTNPRWHLLTKFPLYTPALIATIDRSGSQGFTVSNTNTATVNTVDQVIHLNAGEELSMYATDQNFACRIVYLVGAQTTSTGPYFRGSSFFAPVTGDYTVKVGATANLTFNGTFTWDIYTHPSLPLDGLMPQVGVLPWASDPANPAVVMRYYGGSSLVERIGIGQNAGYQYTYGDIHGAQSPGPSITDKTRRFYASYGDPLLLTPIPPVLDTKELLVQFEPIMPTTDVHGNIYTINIGFAEVGGKAITVTVHYQITPAGDGIAVYEGVRQWDQMEMIIKEDGVEIASQTASRIVNGAFDIAANDGRVGSDGSVEIEIREKTQRVYGFWRGGETSDYNWITLNTNLKDNPYWGNFAHVEFISDNPQYKDDGVTLAVEGALNWVWIKRVEPIFMPTVSANQGLGFGITALPPDPIGTLVSSGSYAYTLDLAGNYTHTQTFALTRGQVIRAGTSVPGGSVTSGSVWRYRVFYDYPNGPMIGDSTFFTEIERQAAVTGNYTVVAEGFSDGAGTIAWEIYSNLRA